VSESLGQRLISRRPLSRFIQIDRLVKVLTGTGTRTTPAFYLPHARYTVFPDADPERSARSFALLDEVGRGVFDDWSQFPPDVAGLTVPLVQHELKAGKYRLTIEASPTCAWRVQVVLNSMMSWEAPPRAWLPPGPPPIPITLGNGASPVFQIAETGNYAMDLVIGGFTRGPPHPKRLCPFRLDLRAADGHSVHLATGESDRAEWPSWQFLGAGQWTVDMDTQCDWHLVVRPMIGPSGGGARWF
jgi:hypothetical protein